jgi:hypothetical protein
MSIEVLILHLILSLASAIGVEEMFQDDNVKSSSRPLPRLPKLTTGESFSDCCCGAKTKLQHVRYRRRRSIASTHEISWRLYLSLDTDFYRKRPNSESLRGADLPRWERKGERPTLQQQTKAPFGLHEERSHATPLLLAGHDHVKTLQNANGSFTADNIKVNYRSPRKVFGEESTLQMCLQFT